MQKDVNLKSNKKTAYPSKTTINLYYKEDKTVGTAVMILCTLLGLVLILAFAKFAVLDKITELNDVKAAYETKQNLLKSQVAKLENYDEVVSQYNRYASSYLKDNEIFCDRMDVLKMLEETVFINGDVESISVSNNTVSISFKELNLEQTADLVKVLDGYEIVESVDVNGLTAQGEVPSVYMVITVTEVTGGEE